MFIYLEDGRYQLVVICYDRDIIKFIVEYDRRTP